jgi:hypothetical protein
MRKARIGRLPIRPRLDNVKSSRGRQRHFPLTAGVRCAKLKKLVGESPVRPKPSKRAGTESCGRSGNALVRSVDRGRAGSGESASKGRLSRRPSWFPTTKAAWRSLLRETISLRRGRGPLHVRKVVFGTQETRPGPVALASRGASLRGTTGAARRAEVGSRTGP